MMSVKKISSILIAIIFLSVSMMSCGKPEDTEVLNAFSDLYEKSRSINEYVFGKGLPYDDPENYDIENLQSPYYIPVSENSPYKTQAEFEAAILDVYSKNYYDVSIKQIVFDGFGENSKENPRYVEVDGVLKIDITNTGAILTGIFDAAAANVVSSSFSDAIVKAPWKSGETVKEYQITLIYGENGWRLDSPTY